MALTSNRQPKHFYIYEKVSEQAFRYTGFFFFSHSVLFLCVRVFGHQEEYFIMSLLRTINCTAYLPSLRCKHCVFIVCFLALAPICHVGMGMFLCSYTLCLSLTPVQFIWIASFARQSFLLTMCLCQIPRVSCKLMNIT